MLCFSVCTYYVRAIYRGDSEFPRFKEMAVLMMKYPSGYEERNFRLDQAKFFLEQFSQDIELAVSANHSTRNYNIKFEHEGVERKVRVSAQGCNGDFVLVYPPKLVMGSIEIFRNNPYSVIITEELSKKLFGNESPLGKTLTDEFYNSTIVFTITGVMKPYLPFSLDGLRPTEMLYNNNGDEGYDGVTYILKPDVNINNLNDRLSKLEFKDNAKAKLFYKEELREIQPIALFLSLIGLFVLLVGVLNFLNTTIGSFANRVEELSLRKILGAIRYQQFFLLLTELLLMLSASFFLCLILSETLMPNMMNRFPAEVSRAFSMSFAELLRHQMIDFICILLLCSLIAFIGVLRIREKHRISKHRIRNFFLGVQFFICMLFVLATGAAYLVSKNTLTTKTPYLKESEMEHVLCINFDKERDILRKYLPEIQQFINSSLLFEEYAWAAEMPYYIENLKEKIVVKHVSPTFFDIMKLPLKIPINEEKPCCIINEALNEKLMQDSMDYIQLDFNIYPVMQVINSVEKSWYLKEVAYIPVTDISPTSIIYVRAKEGKSKEALAVLQKKIQSYLPEYNEFMIHSLKENNTEGHDILQGLFMICCAICILITILGLYGAITIDTERRQKEVAIRKINGAGVKHIYWMFGKSYLWLFVITAIIIFISGLFVMNMLSMILRIFFDYTNPFYWILSFLSVAIVIICTIVYRIYAISRINPAEIIKSE